MTMAQFNVAEAKARFSELVRKAMLGEEVIVAKENKPVTLLIQRGGERRSVTVRMVPENTFFNGELVRKKIGASVQELTPELAGQFQYCRCPCSHASPIVADPRLLLCRL